MKNKLLIMLFTAGFILVTSWPISACTPVINNDAEQVCMAMQNSFDILYGFLYDVEVREDNNFSLHGASIEEAYRYLCEGFTPSMAESILICYSQWQPQHNQLAIIPTEGLPLITTGNSNDVYIKRFNNNEAVFSKYYYNCYEPDDCWQYDITLISGTRGWKISALSLNEIKGFSR
ncbi:MAG: hypothetical protein ACOX6L_02740 [Syntrophomonadaceae bacterium]|jgi:hypothetical protein